MPYCFLLGISHHVFWWGIIIYGGNKKQCWISSRGRRLDGSHYFSEGLWFIIPVLCWTLSIVWDTFETCDSSLHVTVITATDLISSFLFQHQDWAYTYVPMFRIFKTGLAFWIVSRLYVIWNYVLYWIQWGARWRNGQGITLQTGRSRVRFSMVSLGFFSDTILAVALWPLGRLSL
jgi:hypothetical protein